MSWCSNAGTSLHACKTHLHIRVSLLYAYKLFSVEELVLYLIWLKKPLTLIYGLLQVILLCFWSKLFGSSIVQNLAVDVEMLPSSIRCTIRDT